MNKYDKQHNKNVEAVGRQIDRIYKEAVNEASLIGVSLDVDTSKPFTFDDYPQTKERINKMLRKLRDKTEVCIINGINSEWTLANNKCDELANVVFGKNKGKLSQAEYRRYYSTNDDARKAFIVRKDYGLSLSDRVWRYSNEFKTEIEMGLDLGIRNGLSADEMSRELRQYLQHPNMLFRRVRDEHGILHLSQRAKQFHFGRGVYRSSYLNARRLAATETNIAYRTADYDRWKQMDFVVGIEVHLSGNHTCKGRDGKPHEFHDICDELQGKYPKDFKFTGWHPHCRCYATTILKTPEEMRRDTQKILNGQPTDTESVNAVNDTPQGFKDWMLANQERIERATSLPYFLRDNNKWAARALRPEPRELTILEKAALRHQQRTKEEQKAILDAWENRKKLRTLKLKIANNILKVAKDYGEVDYSALEDAISNGDVKKIDVNKIDAITKQTAQQIVAVKKQEEAISDLIPDVHMWHKQFTMNELQKTHTAIKTKLGSLTWMSLSYQKKALEKEIKYVEDPTYLKPHTQYSTWEIAQKAYKNKLKQIIYLQKTESIKTQMSAVESWSANHPKSIKVANLLADYKLAIITEEDINIIQQKATLAYSEYQKRLAEQARRDAKKNGKISTDVHLLQTDKDAYSQKRKDAAIWCKNIDESDAICGDECDELWNNCTVEQQKAWHDYTAGSGHMNRPLRGYSGGWGWEHYKGVGNVPLDNECGEQNIRELKRLLDTTISTRDIWLQRGIETWSGVEGFIGVRNLTRAQLRGMVGRIVTDYSFMSCGSAKGTGFSGTILNIYCPKGSKIFYAMRHSKYKYENETFMQLGATYRITKVEAPDYGNVYIDLELIGYKNHPLL